MASVLGLDVNDQTDMFLDLFLDVVIKALTLELMPVFCTQQQAA